MPWWSIDGKWPQSGDEILAGVNFAGRRGLKLNDRITVLGKQFILSGILNTGGKEDDMLVDELAVVQQLAGLPDNVSQVFVSALMLALLCRIVQLISRNL